METERISDEREQLLQDIAKRINQLLLKADFLDEIRILNGDDSCNEQAPLDENCTISIEQAPLDGNKLLLKADFLDEIQILNGDDSCNEQAPLNENCTISIEQTPLDGNHTAFKKPAPLDGNHNVFNEQMPLDGNHNVLNEQTPFDRNGAISNEDTSSDSDTNSPILPCPRNFERRTNKVSLEEVVQTMYSAWLRNRQPKHEVTLNFFTTKELYALHLAWKNATRGRGCSSQPHKIAEALATAIAKELLPVPECDENDLSIHFHIEFTTTRNLLVANLLDEWPMINEGEWFPARYIETIFEDSDEQPLAVSEFWLRQVELYDKAHDFFLNPKLQVVLHTMLFIWPLSILIIGSKYMECPMGHHLSQLLMILGCIGCSAILYRLALMYLLSRVQYPTFWFWKWKGLKAIEFTFLIVFIVQAVHFFDINPETEPDPNQCVKNFYNAALVTNYVSIPLVSVYVLVRFIIICLNQFDVWHWIIRYL